MPITVFSPHSGRPVKVRDEDIGRAIRDEEGHIFYVVTKHDGKGFYASFTRKGSEKDEERYETLQRQHTQELAQAVGEALNDHIQPPPTIHDATGRKRRWSLFRYAAAIVVLISIIAIIYTALVGTRNLPLSQQQQQWIQNNLPWLDQYQPPVERWPELKQYIPWLQQTAPQEPTDENLPTPQDATDQDPTPSPS